MAVTMDQVRQYTVAFVIIGVALTVGLQILVGVSSEMVVVQQVDNATFTPATPLPTNMTVPEASNSDFVKLRSENWIDVRINDTSASSVKDVPDSDIVVYEEDGKIELTNTSNTDFYNDTEDTVLVDYEYEEEDETAKKGADQATEGLLTFTGWLPLIALVIVAVIIIGLIMRFGSATSRRTRGRA